MGFGGVDEMGILDEGFDLYCSVDRDKFVGCVTAKHNAPNLMRSR